MMAKLTISVFNYGQVAVVASRTCVRATQRNKFPGCSLFRISFGYRDLFQLIKYNLCLNGPHDIPQPDRPRV